MSLRSQGQEAAGAQAFLAQTPATAAAFSGNVAAM